MIKNQKYIDIINKPYQKSTIHPHMSAKERAAQFAPFAALTGHRDVLKETSRLTDTKKILDDTQMIILNRQLQEILRRIKEHPQIKMTYFRADEQKEGGEYITVRERVKKIDVDEHVLILMNQVKIRIDDIYWIEDEFCGHSDCEFS